MNRTDTLKPLYELSKSAYFLRTVSIDCCPISIITFEGNWREPSSGRLDTFLKQCGLFDGRRRSYWTVCDNDSMSKQDTIRASASETIGTEKNADRMRRFVSYKFDGIVLSQFPFYDRAFPINKYFIDLTCIRSSGEDRDDNYREYTDKVFSAVNFDELVANHKDIVAILYNSVFYGTDEKKSDTH